MKGSFRIVVALALLFALAGCSGGALSRTSGVLSIADPYVRTAPAAGGTTGAFMTIVGGSKADHLVQAASDAAEAVELHETVDDNGVMRMRPHPEGWDVPAGGQLELKPGGKHIMLVGVKQPLEAGQEIEITLTFSQAGARTIKLPVRQP